MINRKNIFKTVVLSLFMVIGTQAYAGEVWKATVWYTGGFSTDVSAPSLSQCNQQVQDAINSPPPGERVTGSTRCLEIPGRVHHPGRPRIPELSDFIVFWKWPSVGPEPWPCLQCPPFYFTNDILRLLEPYVSKRVEGLMYEYNIESFKKEIMGIQQKYNIVGFVNELQKIQKDQLQNPGKYGINNIK